MFAKGRSLACLSVVAGMALSSVLLHAQTAQPAPPPPAPAAPPAATASADPDQQFVETTCATCHPIAQVRAKHQGAAEWAATVDKMIGLGAPVTSEEDRDRIIAWLVAHQGPQQ
jgi:quinoprotein glucose dehydrogenase